MLITFNAFANILQSISKLTVQIISSDQEDINMKSEFR